MGTEVIEATIGLSLIIATMEIEIIEALIGLGLIFVTALLFLPTGECDCTKFEEEKKKGPTVEEIESWEDADENWLETGNQSTVDEFRVEESIRNYNIRNQKRHG